MNNQPPALQALDFQAGHSDMLVAARGEPLTKEQIDHNRLLAGISDRFVKSLELHAKELQQRIADDVFRQGSQWGDFKEAVKLMNEKVASWPSLFDVPKDAKIGTQLRIRLPNNYSVAERMYSYNSKPEIEFVDPYSQISMRKIGVYEPAAPDDSPLYISPGPSVGEIRVEAANQTGLQLVVDPLPMALDVGTVFCIEGVKRSDGLVARDFVVTSPVAVGHRVINLYPSICDVGPYKTVKELPKHGARVFIKLPQHSAAMEG